MSCGINSVPYEIIQKILLWIPYDDIISYGMTSSVNRFICNDDSFWIRKLDYVYPNSYISEYVRKYNHPDSKGIHIYNRWKKYNSWSYISLCISRKYNDIVVFLIVNNKKYMKGEGGIYIANYSFTQRNTEIVKYLDTIGILHRDISLRY